jgi:pre-mRNA-splicing factor ISY1
MLIRVPTLHPLLFPFLLEWEEAYSNVREALGLESIPKIPHSKPTTTIPLSSLPSPPIAHSKRKAADQPDGDIDMPVAETTDTAKRPKHLPDADALNTTNGVDKTDVALQHAQAAAAYISFLQPDDLLPPKMPTRQEMEGVLLELRKKALVAEYFGEGGQ